MVMPVGHVGCINLVEPDWLVKLLLLGATPCAGCTGVALPLLSSSEKRP
jgi:hypothetical protein